MKPFKFFIKEQFNIDRSNMPQIDDAEHFCSFLDHKGVSYSHHHGMVNGINPIQSTGMDEEKIANLMHKYKMGNHVPPFIVSGDDKMVIDGHHRYFAASKGSSEASYIEVDTSANQLLKMAYEYEQSRSN